MSQEPGQAKKIADKKIIVDEYWKTQVQAEREAAQKQAAHETPPSESGAGSTPTAAVQAAAGQTSKAAAGEEPPLPPASFPFLLSTLATQAFVALGQIPNPFTGKAEIHHEQARHFIDMLAMLQEKTKGNLTPDESAMLEHLLHELRLIFVTGQNSDERARASEQSR